MQYEVRINPSSNGYQFVFVKAGNPMDAVLNCGVDLTVRDVAVVRDYNGEVVGAYRCNKKRRLIRRDLMTVERRG